MVQIWLQVRTTGEAVVEVGMPDGWGPVGLDKRQMDHVLAELERSLGAAGCDVALLRRRHTHLHSVETAGVVECSLFDPDANMIAAVWPCTSPSPPDQPINTPHFWRHSLEERAV